MRTLCVGTPWQGAQGMEFRAEMLCFLRQDLVPEIGKIVNDPSLTQGSLAERLANAGLLPMFGFPTRSRTLYTRWPFSASSWPMEEGTVGRDLDVALSQFAPGSQTVKDKAVHTAVGVVDFEPKGPEVKSTDGLYPPLPGGNERPLGLCYHCQALVQWPQPLLQPPSGGMQPQVSTCPVCQFQEPSLRLLDAREPKGFFTDLTPRDFEGQFEWQPRSTRPSLAIEAARSGTVEVVGNGRILTATDPISTINDNGGQGGFDLQKVRVYGQPKDGAYAQLATAEDAEEKVTAFGPSWRITLLSRRVTDILLVDIASWPVGVFADPTTVEGRAAWYSFSFWLRLAAGAMLDVDPQELQAGFRSFSDGRRPVGQAFLCDQLENGAGYCRELAKPDYFRRLLSETNMTLSGSVAAKWTEVAAAPGNPTPHAVECDTSCNRCLRDFYNLPYHGLLDWRLALDMARLAASATAPLDLTTAWEGENNPWFGLVEGSAASIPAALERLGYAGREQFGDLRGYPKHATQVAMRAVLILRHPLWQDDHPSWLAAEAAARARYPGYTIKAMNPFRALRRPADCL